MSLRVDLSGNSTGYTQMLSSARAQTKAFTNSITHEVSSSWAGIGKMAAGWIAGVASFEGVKRGLEWFADTGKEIKETAEQVDMSTDSWQKWSSAVGKAGLSIGGFQRIVETLRQKRTEAFTDPKARGDLTRLGFSDAEITGNMDMSTFTMRALANASGGDTQRKYLADIIGARGLKYSTATQYYSGSEPMFSPDDLKQAEELSGEFRKLSKITGTVSVGLVRFFGTLWGGGSERFQNKVLASLAGAVDAVSGRGWLYDKNRKPIDDSLAEADAQTDRDEFFDKSYKPVRAARRPFTPEQMARINSAAGQLPQWAAEGFGNFGASSKAAASGATQADAEDQTKDPLYPQLLKQQEEMALRAQSQQQRKLDSQRGLMTIGGRQASIRGELATLLPQIKDRNEKLKGEGFLTDADKKELDGVTGIARQIAVNAKREKYQGDTDDLELRKERLTGDLKQQPLKFDADSMSKVGLYSASAVAFNPLLGLQQKANQLLGQIASNTSPGYNSRKDPHAP